MSQKNQTKSQTKAPKPEYGPDRPKGVAGPEGVYITRSLERWRLRGDGYL